VKERKNKQYGLAWEEKSKLTNDDRKGGSVYVSTGGSILISVEAFRYSQLRDDLFPDETYKEVWSWLDKELEARKACKTMVGILALAHRADCEKQLGVYLQKLMSSSTLPSPLDLQNKFESREQGVPNVQVNQPGI
jgi:hypothetical protein